MTTHDLNQMKFTGLKIFRTSMVQQNVIAVMISDNTDFNFKDTRIILNMMKLLLVDGFDTEDIFENNQCLGRSNLNKTWKS